MKILKVENNKLVIDENLEAKLLSYEEQKAEMEPIEKQLKEELEEYLKSNEKVAEEISESISCYLKKGYIRKDFDKTRLKKENPEIYDEYIKETQVKDSVVLQFKINE